MKENNKFENQDIRLIAKVYVPVVLIIGIVVLVISVVIGSGKILGAFTTSVSDSIANSRSSTEQKIYDYAEAKNHVKNEISIDVVSAVKTSKLEVLKVNDVEYVIDEIEKLTGTITAWLKVDGVGVFTVDLDAAQYSYDEERECLTVILPRPELTQCTLTSSEIELFKDDQIVKQLGSVEEGEELAAKQIADGYLAVKDYILSNDEFMKSAKKSGEKIMTNVIKSLYSAMPDLVVNIQYQ